LLLSWTRDNFPYMVLYKQKLRDKFLNAQLLLLIAVGGGKVKYKLNWLFQFLMIVGGVSYTLGFLNIGESFFDRFYIWFLTSLWIGIIGNLILKMYEKKRDKDNSLFR
jgi:hypothetical protein